MVGYQDKIKDLKNDQEQVLEETKDETRQNQISNGSYSKLKELTIKHVRSEQSPNELFKAPITCSQEIGWWLNTSATKEKDDSLKWSRVDKHVFAKSEMTAFVDEMTLADKMFKLY